MARLARAVRVIAPANALTEAATVGDEEVVSTSISANPVIAPIVPTLLNSPMKLSGRFILILETVLPLPSNVDANDLARAYRGPVGIGVGRIDVLVPVGVEIQIFGALGANAVVIVGALGARRAVHRGGVV